MTRFDAISFFAVILFLSIFISTRLWNVSVRKTSLKPLSLSTGTLFVATWMFFVTGVLVLIEAFRNMMEPGLWERERLFQGMDWGEIMRDSLYRELLFGWFLFPLSEWQFVQVSWEGIAVGLATLLLVLVVVEILGRKTFGTTWQSRWSITFTAAFLWLDMMTYATVALVRQAAWAL